MTDADRSSSPRPEALETSAAPDVIPDGGAVLWSRLSAEEAAEEWPALRRWVNDWGQRFPNSVRLPDCWWQHNDLVEALSALRDHERACFHPKGSASGGVEWLRGMREIEDRLELWIRRLPCSVPGRGHHPAPIADFEPAGWAEYIAADLDRRRRSDAQASTPAIGPSTG